MSDLFPPEFVAALSQMRLHAGQVPRGGRHAEQTSSHLGMGLEFRDYRSYEPGDDIRRIDWNFYRRSGRLFLRLFEEERDLPVYILLDCSDSMFFEETPRANAAKQAAAILIGASLNEHNKPTLYPFGASLNEHFPAINQRRALPFTLQRLAELGAAGPTDLPAVLRRLNAMRLRRGVVAIISDFFDPAGIETLLQHLHTLPHKILLVRLARDADANPPLEGELLLEDCEGESDLRVTISPASLAAYRRSFDAFESQLLDFSMKRRAGYIKLNAERNVMEQFMDVFNGSLITTYG